MDNTEWGVMKDYKLILEHKSLPRLGKYVPAIEFFMRAWGRFGDDKHHLQPFIKPGLNKVKTYYNKMENSPAYLIAMCK
ncbi:hypothetical protein JVT61DRAFT_3661 [Boletus reticuloceps]|uniref:Uncharacterized protein n=1 Tax=Boletus reticuloceps TaxID=495285 RepID=A0A8I3A7P6_9AGAM|nr:hypothetical protein JVT61DRAFT_3661 [Boletus reticuloceps]